MALLLYLWQLPQNLLGLLLSWIYAPGRVVWRRGVRILRSDKMRGGVSLGRYVIVSSAFSGTLIERHEWGHTRQSLLLGPLYLPVVGLPSLLWAAWWRPGRKKDYYAFYTEKWADALAGIVRKKA